MVYIDLYYIFHDFKILIIFILLKKYFINKFLPLYFLLKKNQFINMSENVLVYI